MRHRLEFERRYLIGRTPWDTGITPPEVMAFLQGRPAGRALDIGCGTGTNAMTLAHMGWAVTAIDFSQLALHRARRKARAAGLSIDFRRVDASRLDGVAGPFDFALDIGCFHSLSPEGRAGYASRLSDLLALRAAFILFSFLAEPGDESWPSRTEIENAFQASFHLTHLEIGETFGRPSAYFTWERHA